ncbi:hypothetical protein AYI68_g7509 [Smittium mucronatum]|uniref:Uncharacterized protein n=1 Tax=Smittium mucronatum TaxID=133383 RepID=A0A1R0GNH8_9FUNG|nr:hypothetical protein AYI68_g7509 [Smittium mucronatum]
MATAFDLFPFSTKRLVRYDEEASAQKIPFRAPPIEYPTDEQQEDNSRALPESFGGSILSLIEENHRRGKGPVLRFLQQSVLYTKENRGTKSISGFEEAQHIRTGKKF